MDNSHYYAVPTARKHNKYNSLITVSAKCGQYSVKLVLARNSHSKVNPAIDAAASYFTKSSARNHLAR